MTLTIDTEFKNLIPALSADELQELTKSCIAEGIRDRIVVWRNGDERIIVDGHNRYAIAQEHGLTYDVLERDFASREHALVWITGNQLGRRNISDYTRNVLALERVKALEAIGKANMAAGGGDKKSDSAKSGFSKLEKPDNEPINAWQDSAQKLGTSMASMSRTKKVETSGVPTVKQGAVAGKLSVNAASEITKLTDKLPEDNRERAIEVCGGVDSSQLLVKLKKLVSLYKSSGSETTNGTYDEIMASGGFHYGKDMDKWLDYAEADFNAIISALNSVADYHKKLAMEAAKQDMIANRERQASDLTAKITITDYVQGDCLDIIPTLPDKSIKLLLTDPPYGTSFQSNRRTESAQASAIANDNPDDAIALLSAMLNAVNDKMASDSRLLIFTSQRYYPDFLQVIINAGYTIGRVLTWVKENHTSGNLKDFAPQTEWIINAWRGNVEITPRISEVLKVSRQTKTTHPTEKPIELLRQLINVTTVRDEFILDPFAGTAATVEAARLTHRRALGIELESEWYNEGIVRLQS